MVGRSFFTPPLLKEAHDAVPHFFPCGIESEPQDVLLGWPFRVSLSGLRFGEPTGPVQALQTSFSFAPAFSPTLATFL